MAPSNHPVPAGVASTVTRLRRCAGIIIEPREDVSLDLAALIAGGTGLQCRTRWIARVPALDADVELTIEELAALAGIAEADWVEIDADAGAVAALRRKGLVVADGDDHAGIGERDACFRAAGWHVAAAYSHLAGRWQGVDTGAERERCRELRDAIGDRLGTAPAAAVDRGDPSRAIPLPAAASTALDELLERRVTCRNFDRETAVPLEVLASVLGRVFGARAHAELQPGHVLIKRNCPSAGGLHPTEAYVLVQRVQHLAPGLYHYRPLEHALAPMPGTASATRLLAGQTFFADAPVLLLLCVRFERNFWKYRHHSKALRAVTLDVGHLSQLLYTTATELGLGAFVTAAINDHDIEQALGLDPLREGPIAACGFGPRAARVAEVEFDPLARVWPPS